MMRLPIRHVLPAALLLAGLAAVAGVRDPSAASIASGEPEVVTLTGVHGVWTDQAVTAANASSRGFQSARLTLREGWPIRLRLQSADVVHSFSAPALGLDRVEIYPGRVIEMTVTPRHHGSFEYYCTTVCGPEHFGMRGALLVLGAEDAPPAVDHGAPATSYWLEPPPATQDPVQRGAWHFRQKGCATCHGVEGQGGVANPNAMNAEVPELATLARRTFLFSDRDVAAFQGLLLSMPIEKVASESEIAIFSVAREQYLAFRRLVRDGRDAASLDVLGLRPPLDMPAWGARLSDREIDLVLAYLLGLGQVGRGQKTPAGETSKGETS